MDRRLEEQRESLMTYISEASKDVYGVRIPCDPNMTLEELTEEADRLSAEIKRQIDEERAEEESVVKSLCGQFDCTRRDLERWDVI